jgi:hypothetical protein
MTNPMDPSEAGAALAEVRRRQGQVIEGALVPGWYWWAVAIPMVGLGFVVDGHQPIPIALAAILFALGVAVFTGWIIFGGLRHVKVNETLLGPRGAGRLIGFVWLLVGGTLALAFLLQFAGAAYPATISTLACAVALVIGGPALMRRLRQSMEHRAAGVR